MEKTKSIIFIALVLVMAPFCAFAATLYVSPASGTYEVGQRVSIKVVASSEKALNAISGNLSIPTSIFTVESVSKTGSILNFWVTEPAIKAGGVVGFEGVALNGYTGNSGTVVTITLKAAKIGSGTVSFQSGEILANDGQGTNITGTLTGATFTVKAAPPPKPAPTPTPVPVPEPVPEPVKPAEPEKLNAPEIVYGSKYGLPAILGKSEHHDAKAVISFTSYDGSKIFVTSDIDESGEFAPLVPNSLKTGSYEVNAYVVNDKGLQSDSSNTLNISVGNFFSDISTGLKIAVLSIVSLLLLALLLLLIKMSKNRRTLRGLRKEKKEAEFTLHQSFDQLRTDITEQIKTFEKIQNNRPLTDQENKTLHRLRSDLDDFEKTISKEIEDIGS